MSGWIGVDFDGTLSKGHATNGGRFGEPVPVMIERIKNWIARGHEVRIVTARAVDPIECFRVSEWLTRHGLPSLIVTDRKDFGMMALYDDRAVAVERDTGKVLGGVEV